MILRLAVFVQYRSVTDTRGKNDDDDDEGQDAAADVSASVYTPVYIKLFNTYPMMIVEIDRI